MREQNLPQHFRFINPIVEVLRESGGSGRSSEVTDMVIEKLGISDNELEDTLQSGGSRIKNQIHWARMVLVKIGFIDSSQRGVWSLTEKGMHTNLSREDLVQLYKNRKQWVGISNHGQKIEHESIKPAEPDECANENSPEIVEYRNELLKILQSVSPSGFERICQRLLRESGFEQVNVTGRSGDGGIDGNGIYQVNPFLSFNILFQCKRYQGTVSASQIRDFRGAMMGRADKGLIITTGFFSLDAKKEARRDGVPPIEIVDGEKLIDMFELLELGLKPKKTYEVDFTFFEEFK